MRERPILFSGPMVRAILDGTKTQTRRLIKPQPTQRPRGWGSWEKGRNGERCPHGMPGDRLWVRETWGPCAGGVVYRADDCGDTVRSPDAGRWRPSIHMPRWASRITLEITEVRVQRLQEISKEDAAAEGFAVEPCLPIHPCDWFRNLWDSLNGKRAPWDANPWVWAISFRRVDGGAACTAS